MQTTCVFAVRQVIGSLGTLLVVVLWPRAICLRHHVSSVDVSLQRGSGLLARKGERQRQLRADAPPLKVLASTFNAGNRKYSKASDADDTIPTLVKDHEEADLVILGLQEYLDTAYDRSEVSERVRKNFLWQHPRFQKNFEVLQNRSRRAAPPAVVDARDAILRKFEAFQHRIAAEVQGLKDSFGGGNHSFLSTVAAEDPATAFTQASVPASRAAQDTIAAMLRSYEESKATAPQRQFGALSERLNALQSAVGEFDVQSYKEHFDQIHQWGRSMEDEHRRFLQQHPNLQFTDHGRTQHERFVHGFQHVPGAAHSSLDSGLGSILDAAKQFQGRVEDTAAKVSEQVVSDTIAKWKAVLNDIEKLDTDVAAIQGSEAVRNQVSSAVASQVLSLSESIEGLLSRWKDDVQTHVSAVGQLSHFDLTHAELEIPVVSEVFTSDSALQNRKDQCHLFSHYNTDLRVYASPWSPWRLNRHSIVQYSIDFNGEVSGFADSIKNGQCGKGTNVIKFQLEAHTGHRMNMCVLNSHQSFKFPFHHRLSNLDDAMRSLRGENSTSGKTLWSARNLDCHAVVFAADFNSRLLCRPDEVDEANSLSAAARQVPLADVSVDGRSSFQNIRAAFTNEHNAWALSSSELKHADELTHMLEKETLACFEKDKGSDDGWQLKDNVANPLFHVRHRLREADKADFAPTYKLAKMSEYKGKGKKKLPLSAWNMCYPQENYCLLNEDQDFKHNPGWTDRILVQDSDLISVHTTQYSRRPFTSELCDVNKKRPKPCSDHAPVVAMLSLEFRGGNFTGMS